MSRSKRKPMFEMDSLDEIVYKLTGDKVQIMVMIPDVIKDKCKPNKL